MTAACLILALAISTAPRASATSISLAGVAIQARADPQIATVGDPIKVDFDITVPPGYRVQAPSLSGQMGDFSVLQFYPGPVVPGAAVTPPANSPGGGQPQPHYRARLIVALYKPGEYSFPPVTFELLDPSGKKGDVSSQSLNIRIRSTLGDKDQKLKDLKNQAEISEPVRWALWLAIGMMLLILGAIFWWWWNRRRRRLAPSLPAQPRLDPLQLAESELRDLLSRGLLEKGLTKQFYVLLSEITKRTLEAGYGIQTVEKTTSEIMDELKINGTQVIPAPESDRIHSVLTASDLVKFAKHLPARSESEASVKLAFEILEACRKRRVAQATVVHPAGEA